jgi:hypothetical protein
MVSILQLVPGFSEFRDHLVIYTVTKLVNDFWNLFKVTSAVFNNYNSKEFNSIIVKNRMTASRQIGRGVNIK